MTAALVGVIIGAALSFALLLLVAALEAERPVMKSCRKHGEYAGYPECPGCAGRWPGRGVSR